MKFQCPKCRYVLDMGIGEPEPSDIEKAKCPKCGFKEGDSELCWIKIIESKDNLNEKCEFEGCNKPATLLIQTSDSARHGHNYYSICDKHKEDKIKELPKVENVVKITKIGKRPC